MSARVLLAPSDATLPSSGPGDAPRPTAQRLRPSALAVRHVTKRFGAVLALDDVSLDIAPGERLALVGENGAGKSSLANVLYGLYRPDAGALTFDGSEVRLRSPADALRRGVGMVHQHFTLVPTLTVAENVVLGREPTRGLRLDEARAARDVAETCGRLGFTLDPRARVRELSVGAQQKVEIVKALHRGARVLLLDEPTAVLTPQEADELLALLRRLSDDGLTVVLVSHRLHEVLAFASRVAVLRRGRLVAERPAAGTSAQALAALVLGVGEPPTTPLPPADELRAPARRAPAVEPALRVEELAVAPGLRGVSFEVHPGEILGIAGVDGNGQRELALALTGLVPASGGRFFVDGRAAVGLSPAALRAQGLAHIPEDRLRRGLVGELSAEENLALGGHGRPPFARGPLVDFRGRRAHATALLARHDVRPQDPSARAGALSGGNQQKLVVARELAFAPRLLVAVQPTRGLDLGAERAVRDALRRARDGGCGVLLVSLDLDELLELSDRLLTLCAGRVTGVFRERPFDERAVGRAMLGAHLAA